MLLNFYYTLNTGLTSNITCSSTTYIYSAVGSYTSWLDLPSRVMLDDFFTNSYYYWWTTFWYIPIFIVTLYVCNLTLLSAFLPKLLHLIVVCGCASLGVEVVEYWLLNTDYLLSYTSAESVNSLLLNSINKYHPYILYLTVVFLTISVVVAVSATFEPKCQHNPISSYQVQRQWHYVYTWLIVLTLFMGGWWALQEGSWGGWWNWDASEVFGLMLMLCLVVVIHSHLFLTNQVIFIILIRNSLLVLTLVYSFIQLNFTLISHNFGLKPHQFINTLQIFFITLSLFLALIGTASRSYHKFNYGYILFFKYYATVFKPLTTATFLGYSLGIIGLVLYSLIPLINDFIWKTLSVNILTLGLDTVTLVLWVILYLSLTFYTTQPLIIYCIGIYISVSYSSLDILLFLNTIPVSRLAYLHSLYYVGILATFVALRKNVSYGVEVSNLLHISNS
jgi:hypothetical protein